jgi:ATP-dependent DNA helicase RecG
LVTSENISAVGKARINTLRATTDGFVIAEEDLKLRGPGEVTGIHQSGYLTLGIADPVRDRELLEMAREDAFSA